MTSTHFFWVFPRKEEVFLMISTFRNLHMLQTPKLYFKKVGLFPMPVLDFCANCDLSHARLIPSAIGQLTEAKSRCIEKDTQFKIHDVLTPWRVMNPENISD